MRAYGRRHRRWSRRNPQPLLFVPEEPLLIVGLAALGRVLFRYRSELAPITAGVVLAVAGFALHHSHPGAWPAVAILAVAAALVAGLRGFPWGIARAEERVFAAMTTAVAGGWLTAATALGPGQTPLPTILVVSVVALGVPWWAHRRRRARVRVDRVIHAWPDLAEAVGLDGSRVMSAVVNTWGWRARMKLRPGQSVTDVVARVPDIESALGTRPGAVRVEQDPAHAGRCTMRVLAVDPHAGAIPWPGPAARSLADPIELGVFEDATTVRVPLLRRHALIGGTTDSGKSGVLNVVLGNLAACSDVVLWGIDLKGGMELRPWAPCLARLATTPDEATQLLADAVAVLDARAHASSRDNTRVWEPAPDAPALVIVIDEYAELADAAPAAVTYAESVARRGRAVAVDLLAATQRPTQKAMGGGALRSQMSVRVCLRVRERRDVDLILDKGMLAAGWHAHTLDAPGKFYVLADGHNQPRRARAYLVTDDHVRETAARYADQRPDLDPLSQAAIDGQPRAIGSPSIGADDPEQALLTALGSAPDDGLTIPELIDATGMRRTWIYDRLQALAAVGRARQVARGRWRA
ncbi:FtsK/SpoIIIE domain-containing protein [Paractinoplanes atraurantiacus]|uniref:DNA segregation ATPase FtsK/SpoIIIE, S-DNA-T family n=1 Tax=Paractinoplanes atraurantiacus TaxID=1036182 RepID=A0A285GRH1_9ACTN|nr:FtsK/SpoIIIE domain-containing protein [Actinoplanes atraurantiacus]SNY25834.1 DNA segregation ATPase FtsK/SpoIIIE, S-DNA-T family [Actinoplanes atraurantiacus]